MPVRGRRCVQLIPLALGHLLAVRDHHRDALAGQSARDGSAEPVRSATSGDQCNTTIIHDTLLMIQIENLCVNRLPFWRIQARGGGGRSSNTRFARDIGETGGTSPKRRSAASYRV